LKRAVPSSGIARSGFSHEFVNIGALNSGIKTLESAVENLTVELKALKAATH
jgi:hypothetical protein